MGAQTSSTQARPLSPFLNDKRSPSDIQCCEPALAPRTLRRQHGTGPADDSLRASGPIRTAHNQGRRGRAQAHSSANTCGRCRSCAPAPRYEAGPFAVPARQQGCVKIGIAVDGAMAQNGPIVALASPPRLFYPHDRQIQTHPAEPQVRLRSPFPATTPPLPGPITTASPLLFQW